ncbi:hypothetical protein HCN44_001371 [Aphidius gifuensis]|uniref:Cuticular protein n=1 Tax=Aphidius gifuensis TaxID=684658 RepID=A0A834XTQ5_APHGI|nr:larval/pupal cuticle protein H1C-like [Aphidius gifuensis]KAF7992046.1 hypothetical protein HCN44_001371 [Aphidius gifuensis]
MMSKCYIVLSAIVAACSAGNIAVPVAAAPAALTVGTYASTYNSHSVEHAHAAPIVASYATPYVAPAYSAYSTYSAPLSAAAYYPAYSPYSAYAAPAVFAARR